MKLYNKTINGVTHILPYNKIVVINNGMQIFNPSEEILFQDGWKEYIPQESVITDEEMLKIEKEHLIDDILYYDSSENVNVFYINNIPIWLDKATRAGLMLRFQAEKALSKTETSIWYGDNEFRMPLEDAVIMLYLVEIYASACYDNTQKHIHNVKLIKNMTELKSYDYMTGYPEKHRF